MRSLLHRLSDVLAEFGALDVHLISQSSNNLNLTFVVDEALADELIPRLHALLIRADALRVEDGAVFGPSWRELANESGGAASATTGGGAIASDCSRSRMRAFAALRVLDRRPYAQRARIARRSPPSIAGTTR